MPRKEVITPSNIRPPRAPFSLVTRFGNLVYVAGQTAFNPEIGDAQGDIREQTRTTLERIKVLLEAAGTSLDNVLSATCYLVKREDFAAFNEEYARYFPTDRPARATVQAQLMAPSALVEIMVTACIPDEK